MMFKENKPYSRVLPFLMILFVLSCKHKEGEYHSVTDKYEELGKKFQGTSISSEELLQDEDLIEITEGEHTFLIPERKGKIASYACTECHSKPLDEMRSNGYSKKAHWDITLNHADAEMMNCITCHNGNDMDELANLSGKQVDFNMSYKLCSQCHSPQFEDWKGGAHGKKVAGWAPPRASMTCVNCHNPHDPAFKPKWPARFNRKKAVQRK